MGITSKEFVLVNGKRKGIEVLVPRYQVSIMGQMPWDIDFVNEPQKGLLGDDYIQAHIDRLNKGVKSMKKRRGICREIVKRVLGR